MSKQVYRDARIILGGHDVSHRVQRWMVGAKVGELFMVTLDIQDDGTVTFEEKDERFKPSGLRLARNGGDRKIFVNGTDISRWVYGYDRIVVVGEVDLYRLHLQADREVISINGTYPWEVEQLAEANAK